MRVTPRSADSLSKGRVGGVARELVALWRRMPELDPSYPVVYLQL
jgi:hypothetical protein